METDKDSHHSERMIRFGPFLCEFRSFFAAVVICTLLCGCGIAEEGGPTPTSTPNPTLVFISRMLTETRAAPTITFTPTITPTRVITPSVTAELILPGMRKLPAPGQKRFVQNNIALTILAVQEVKALQRLKADKGSAYLDLEVLLENESAAPHAYNPLDFRLLAPAGELLQPAVDALKPALLSGELRPGEWVRGHLAFPVAEGSGASLLRYRPDQSGAWPGETWLDLSGVGSSAPQVSARRDWPSADLPAAAERQEASGVALTVEKVEVSSKLQRKAEKGSRFVTFSVKIENLTRDRTPFNPFYFRVKDSQGYEYLPILGSPSASLQAGSLGRGQMVRNSVIFELPETEQVLVLTYQPTVLVEDYQPIRMLIELPEQPK